LVYYTISIILTYITANKTVSVLVIGVQCSTRLTEHSTSVPITSRLRLLCCTSFHDRYLLVFCTQFYEYRHFGCWIWELAKITTVLKNNLLSKMT